MPSRFAIAPLLSAVLALCALPSKAGAQSDPHADGSSAEAHYQTAVRLFGEGRYREALDEFDAAIEQSPESIFFCNRAIVLIQLTEVDEALHSLETCQNTFTGARSELAAIDAQRLAVERVVRSIRPAAFGTISSINAPVLDPIAPEGDGWTRASTGYVLLAAGGALLASAATLDLLSGDVRRNLEAEAQGPRGSNEEDYVAAREAYVGRQRIWLGLAGAGAVASVIGASLVVTHFLFTPEAPVAVGVSPGAATVSILLAW